MAKHSSIGASSAYRWFTCPGSVRLCEQAPPSEQSIYAAEGSAAHSLAEKCYGEFQKTGMPVFADLFIGESIKQGEYDIEVTEEMAEAVNVYLEFLYAPDDSGYPTETQIEIRFDLSRIYPGLFGTSDCVKLIVGKRKLVVADYKHGAGIPVEVEANSQLLYYALGAILHMYEHTTVGGNKIIDDPTIFGWDQFDEVEIVVIQPRARHVDGPVRRWSVPKDILNQFQDKLVEAAKRTSDPAAELKAGGHCRFCPAIAICPAQLQLVSSQAAADFTPITKKEEPVLPSAESLTIEQLAGVLKYSDQIQAWLKAVNDHAFKILESGGEVPGFKLVKKRSNRKWISEDDAMAVLGAYLEEDKFMSKPQLLSPAKVEKLLKKADKKLLETLCEKPDNGNTIADEHDPREAVSASAQLDFEVL